VNYHTALNRLDKLDQKQIRQMIQQLDAEIANYRIAIQNYSPDRLERYGNPFLARLQVQRQLFADRLENNNA
jgi:hypothetical protein